MGFKIMVTPSWVRISFLVEFIIGSVFILIQPLRMINYIVRTSDTKQTMFLVVSYFVIVFLGIPALAIILHMVNELAMIPFSILNTLLEIRNKLDEKAKN